MVPGPFKAAGPPMPIVPLRDFLLQCFHWICGKEKAGKRREKETNKKAAGCCLRPGNQYIKL
jgi:hypothetical protein